MNESEAIKIYRYLVSAFPSAVLDKGNADVWIDGLAGVPVDTAMNAARRWIMTSKWFPTIAEFADVLADARYDDFDDRTRSVATAVADWAMANPWSHDGPQRDRSAIRQSAYRAALDSANLHRLVREYPTAPADVLAASYNGDTHSLAYFQRVLDCDELEAG